MDLLLWMIPFVRFWIHFDLWLCFSRLTSFSCDVNLFAFGFRFNHTNKFIFFFSFFTIFSSVSALVASYQTRFELRCFLVGVGVRASRARLFFVLESSRSLEIDSRYQQSQWSLYFSTASIETQRDELKCCDSRRA